MYHIPVFLHECIDGLNTRPGGIYVDVTFGSGGHSREILRRIEGGRVIAFDRDPDAERNKPDDARFQLVSQNYRYLKNYLAFYGIQTIDGLIADLGISSWQIDQPERGFSTRHEGRLDMRMDQEQQPDAREIVNTRPAGELARIFQMYGEIENSRRLAGAIELARQEKPVDTTADLKTIALRCAPRGKENQYLARVFQALRIEVNEEIESLKELLIQATEVIVPGGRIAIISYHSLEDRLVKNFFRSGNFDGKLEKDFYGKVLAPLRPVNRKAITPGTEEIARNPRARSAKLRIAERI